YGSDLLANVRALTNRVDATFDAAGKGGLQDAITLTGGTERAITLPGGTERAITLTGGTERAITLTGGTERVITLADERAAEHGVRLSAPTPDRAPDAVEIGMQLLGSGELRLRSQ